MQEHRATAVAVAMGMHSVNTATICGDEFNK